MNNRCFITHIRSKKIIKYTRLCIVRLFYVDIMRLLHGYVKNLFNRFPARDTAFLGAYTAEFREENLFLFFM